MNSALLQSLPPTKEIHPLASAWSLDMLPSVSLAWPFAILALFSSAVTRLLDNRTARITMRISLARIAAAIFSSQIKVTNVSRYTIACSALAVSDACSAIGSRAGARATRSATKSCSAASTHSSSQLISVALESASGHSLFYTLNTQRHVINAKWSEEWHFVRHSTFKESSGVDSLTKLTSLSNRKEFRKLTFFV